MRTIVRTLYMEIIKNQVHTIIRIIFGGLLAKKRANSSILKEDLKNLELVGYRIREIREKKKLSVYDITGEDMPIKSRQHWQRIENGQKNITLTTVFKVAETLGVKVSDLFQNM